MNTTALIDTILAHAKTDECIVLATKSTTDNLRWANTTLTTNGSAAQHYLAIFAIDDGRVGSVVTSLDSHTDVLTLLRSAEAKTALVPKAFDAAPVLGGAGTWAASARRAEASATSLDGLYGQLETCFRATRQQSLALFGYSETKQQDYWIATSRGLRSHTTHQEASVDLNLKTTDFTTSVWAGMAAHAPAELDLAGLFSRLERRMAWSEHPIALPPGKYETILEPSAVADLLIYSYWSSAARHADEGKSVFSRPGGKNAVGEQLYAPGINIYSDPHAPGLGVPPVEIAFATSAEQSIFDNGLELTKTAWVTDGVQQALITPRYWAAKQKTKPTPYIANLLFDHPSGPSVEDMIAITKHGLLVTCLWYIREVDPQTLLLTGLTRDGVFLVENGQVVGAVNNFRFNMSPVQLLQQAVEIGASQPTLAREFGDYFTFASMPPLRVKDFNMSTVSDAI